MRVIGLLHQTVSLDANLATARMNVGRTEVGLNLGRDTVLHLDREQIRAGDALIAVSRNDADTLGFNAHGNPRRWQCFDSVDEVR